LGSVGKEENLEEVLAPPKEVYSVLTDIDLARMWGQTNTGTLLFPSDPRMKLGQTVDLAPKGMKEPLRLKIKIMHYEEFIELEVVDGPMFGILKINLETRPYGTLLTSSLDYGIESMGFNLKWRMNERKKYRQMMDAVLANIKNLTEQRRDQ
jgi:hypothetical protein